MFAAILVIVSFFAILVVIGRVRGKQRRAEVGQIIASAGYELTYTAYNYNLSQLFGVDDSKRRIVIIEGKESYSVPFEDLLGSDIRIDGSMVTSTSTGSLVGRSVVAGAIGALTAEKETRRVIKDINVVIRTNNVTHRIIDLHVYNGGAEQERYLSEAERINDLINIIHEDCVAKKE